MSVPRAASATPTPPLHVWCYACVPASDRGGVQAVFGRVARGLARAGDRVVTAWAHPPVRSSGEAGTADLHLPLATRLERPVVDGLAVLRSVAMLARRLREDRPDIVNVHFPMGQAAYFALLRPLLGYRLVLSLHGSDLTNPAGPVRRVFGPLLRRGDAVVVVSRAMARIAVERYRVDPARVHLIPNAIDTRFWCPPPGGAPLRDAGHDHETPAGRSAPLRLLGVGRLVEVKGFDLLIDAFAVLRAERPDLDATLEIVGEGPARDELAARIAKAGLGERVALAGHLGREALRARLRAATLFVLPSRSEGAPLALLEAMAVGTPVLASDVGGVGEALAALPDCLVEPDSIDALALGLARRLDDPSARARGVALGLEAVAERDERTVVETYRALFGRLVARPAPRPAAGAVVRP